VSTPTNPAPPLSVNAASLDDIGERFLRYQKVIARWIEGNALELLVAVGIGVLLYLVLSWVRRRAARAAVARGHDSTVATIALRALARTSRFFRVMIAVQLVNGFANTPTVLSKTIVVLFTISTVIQVAIWLREIILSMVERRVQMSGSENDTLASAMALIRMAVSFALFAIAAIVILSNLGVNVTGLVAGLGVGGIAIGLAAQGIFSDLFAAVAIIFDQPFKRGDTVTYDTTTARVERIGMKSTRLRALTGEEKIISNSKLLEKEITNNTQSVYRRVTFMLSLVYHIDPALAARIPQLLREIVETSDAEFVRAGFHTFGPSSLDFQLVFDVPSEDVDAMFETRHVIGMAIVIGFAKEGIEFAYPTQTTYTASPDGVLVMPYATAAAAAPTKPTRRV
jgi:small-conductance mechanosensitive channel